jgi:potassium channel subfamily K
VLTIRFRDYIASNDTGRGLIFPYSVIEIIFLGLIINSIRKFTIGISKDKVIRKHQLQKREETFGRTVISEKQLRDRLRLPPKREPTEIGRALLSRKIIDGIMNTNPL